MEPSRFSAIPCFGEGEGEIEPATHARVASYRPRIVHELDREHHILSEDAVGSWSVKIEFSSDENRPGLFRLTLEVDLACYHAILGYIKVEIDGVRAAALRRDLVAKGSTSEHYLTP